MDNWETEILPSLWMCWFCFAFFSPQSIITAVDGHLISFKERTLPAAPMVNRFRFEAAIRHEQGSGTFPGAFICTILAQTACAYYPEMVKSWSLLWAPILAALEDEYRMPRLQTLQATLALLQCPQENHGQNGMLVARVRLID